MRAATPARSTRCTAARYSPARSANNATGSAGAGGDGGSAVAAGWGWSARAARTRPSTISRASLMPPLPEALWRHGGQVAPGRPRPHRAGGAGHARRQHPRQPLRPPVAAGRLAKPRPRPPPPPPPPPPWGGPPPGETPPAGGWLVPAAP